MGSGAVIYVPSFIKIGSGIQKLISGGEGGGVHTHTHRQQCDLMSQLLFFHNKESRLTKVIECARIVSSGFHKRI
jgi:hypothetical protein